MTKRKAQIAAYHEAGHAVAHVTLGMDFDYVTIVPNDDSGGHVALTRPDDIVEMWNSGDRDDARVRNWIERDLIANLAGHVAQRRAFPRSRWRAGFGVTKSPGGFIPEGEPMALPKSDLQHVMRIIDDLHGGDGEEVMFAYHAYVQARAETLVRMHLERNACFLSCPLDHPI